MRVPYVIQAAHRDPRLGLDDLDAKYSPPCGFVKRVHFCSLRGVCRLGEQHRRSHAAHHQTKTNHKAPNDKHCVVLRRALQDGAKDDDCGPVQDRPTTSEALTDLGRDEQAQDGSKDCSVGHHPET